MQHLTQETDSIVIRKGWCSICRFASSSWRLNLEVRQRPSWARLHDRVQQEADKLEGYEASIDYRNPYYRYDEFDIRSENMKKFKQSSASQKLVETLIAVRKSFQSCCLSNII